MDPVCTGGWNQTGVEGGDNKHEAGTCLVGEMMESDRKGRWSMGPNNGSGWADGNKRGLIGVFGVMQWMGKKLGERGHPKGMHGRI